MWPMVPGIGTSLCKNGHPAETKLFYTHKNLSTHHITLALLENNHLSFQKTKPLVTMWSGNGVWWTQPQ